jgi:hypothetical protein
MIREMLYPWSSSLPNDDRGEWGKAKVTAREAAKSADSQSQPFFAGNSLFRLLIQPSNKPENWPYDQFE